MDFGCPKRLNHRERIHVQSSWLPQRRRRQRKKRSRELVHVYCSLVRSNFASCADNGRLVVSVHRCGRGVDCDNADQTLQPLPSTSLPSPPDGDLPRSVADISPSRHQVSYPYRSHTRHDGQRPVDEYSRYGASILVACVSLGVLDVPTRRCRRCYDPPYGSTRYLMAQI